MSNSKQIDGSGQPFTTQDAELALSLITAGCRMAAVEHGGPAQMHYTPEICRNRWVTRKDPVEGAIRVPLMSHAPQTPVQFEKAVMRAVKSNIPGAVTYYIVRDEVFQESIKMHDRMVKEATLAARQKRAMVIPRLTLLTEAEQIMIICYVRRANKELLEGHAWVRSPNLVLGNIRKQVTPKEGVPGNVLEQVSFSSSGTGKMWSLSLSDEKRATPDKDGRPFIHPKPRD